MDEADVDVVDELDELDEDEDEVEDEVLVVVDKVEGTLVVADWVVWVVVEDAVVAVVG